LLNVEAHWWKVEIFTVYQLIAAEMQVRGRVQHALQAIAEGYASKLSFGVVRTVEIEPPAPDQALERTRRFVYFQGSTFTVKGSVEFPVAADPVMHREMLFKAKFFPVVEATITVVGVELPPIQWPACFVNRDQMVALYLG
jgi:hypothetical protein